MRRAYQRRDDGSVEISAPAPQRRGPLARHRPHPRRQAGNVEQRPVQVEGDEVETPHERWRGKGARLRVQADDGHPDRARPLLGLNDGRDTKLFGHFNRADEVAPTDAIPGPSSRVRTAGKGRHFVAEGVSDDVNLDLVLQSGFGE
jgi:hypothetical protein